MNTPTVEESLDQIRARGNDIASQILSERGLVFREATTKAEAADITENEVERFIAEEDFEAAASSTDGTLKLWPAGPSSASNESAGGDQTTLHMDPRAVGARRGFP